MRGWRSAIPNRSWLIGIKTVGRSAPSTNAAERLRRTPAGSGGAATGCAWSSLWSRLSGRQFLIDPRSKSLSPSGTNGAAFSYYLVTETGARRSGDDHDQENMGGPAAFRGLVHQRSEERRVGKECVRACRSRG